VRGVIAPESSNNAKLGGALIPTLLFGIPGSATMTVFLSAMILMGLESGPNMVGKDLDKTYMIIWSLAIASLFGFIICVVCAPVISRLTQIKFVYLLPFLIATICFAVVQLNESLFDLVFLLIFSLIGIVMKRYGWSRPALLIGYVLATQADIYTYQAIELVAISGLSYLVSPTSIVLTLVSILSLFYCFFRSSAASEAVPVSDDNRSIVYSQKMIGGVLFVLFCAAAFVIMQVVNFSDKIFPVIVSLIAAVCVMTYVIALFQNKVNVNLLEDEQAGVDIRSYVFYQLPLIWIIVGLCLLSCFVGFYFALSVVVCVTLMIKTKRYVGSALLSIAIGGGIYQLSILLNRDLSQLGF